MQNPFTTENFPSTVYVFKTLGNSVLRATGGLKTQGGGMMRMLQPQPQKKDRGYEFPKYNPIDFARRNNLWRTGFALQRISEYVTHRYRNPKLQAQSLRERAKEDFQGGPAFATGLKTRGE